MDPHERRVSVWLAGSVPVVDHLATAERLCREAAEPGGRGPCLVLCEHEPAITIGRAGSRTDILLPEPVLVSANVAVRFTGRGGGAVAHGPGQVVVAVFAKLEDLGFERHDVGGFLSRFEAALATAIRASRCPAVRHPGLHGVYGSGGLIAALGLAVRRGVVCHGAFVNVCPSPRIMGGVRASARGPMVSMQSEVRRRILPTEFRTQFVEAFGEAFGIGRLNVLSGYPGRGPRPVPARPAAINRAG
jgi:lipoyl(octanoyl) transferase